MQTDYIAQIGIISLFMGLFLSVYAPIRGCINRAKYRTQYSLAELQATRQFGDKLAPLTPEERQEWYQIMNIKDDSKPTIRELEKYLSQADK